MKHESTVLDLKRFERGSRNSAGQSETTVLSSSPTDDVSPTVMLRLLTHCYATGVYASGEIERKLRKSPTRQPVPDAKTIQRFRRYNRAALQSALELTLQLHQSVVREESTTMIRLKAAEKLEIAAIHDMSLEE